VKVSVFMDRKWPLVSICVLSFNRVEYLKRTIESFRSTCTYPCLEWVVVDNGSSDGVASYINSLTFVNKKIMNSDNMGMGYAMNQARRVAEGEYFFNLENDWFFFYKSDWLERGVHLFEKDMRGEPVEKEPGTLPLGLVKYKLGSGAIHYTNNPSLLSRSAYEDVGEYPQYGREYGYVSEDVHLCEPHYIKRFDSKYSCALSETPCALHIGSYTTNPMYGNRRGMSFHELDNRLKGEWKNGKWWLTYRYMMLWNRWKIRRALQRYRKFEESREDRR
jgi:glycosyltransferase involved in cell wall biosynthesis